MTEVRERLVIDDHDVPLVVWRPATTAPHPLVLAGHGGGGHKDDAFVTLLRDRLCPAGIAVAAIDAAGHGERLVPGASAAEAGIIEVLSDPRSYDTMVGDWIGALDWLLAAGEYRPDSVGYAGLSGGTLFGLPFVAADTRISAAAIGVAGYEGAELLGGAPGVFAPVLHAAARRYERPLLFLLQRDDELFPVEGGQALFEDIASADRELLESPGAHREVPEAATARMCDWLAERIA